MSPPVQVHMLPQLIEAGVLSGGVAVIVDVLRASTTIVHALAHGARAVIPCESVEQARLWAARLSPDRPLLGGERQGRLIEGFDLDNSPLAYGADVVAGRTIVFTTTNGTRALEASRHAECILIGAFVNRATLLRRLALEHRPVHIVCAGTDGHLTAEDVLFAGCLAHALRPEPSTACPDVQTEMARDYYVSRSVRPETFLATMRGSRGGQNLLQLGFDADIVRAATLDLFDIVPEWHRSTNEIVASDPPVRI